MIADFFQTDNFLSIEECEELKRYSVKKLKNSSLVGEFDYSIRKHKSFFILNNSQLDPLLREILEKVKWKIRKVSSEYFKCDLCSTEPALFSRYQKGDFFNWHLDAGPKQNRDISASIFLDDPSTYKGGEFEFRDIFLASPTPSQGSLLVFPSLLSHRISEVQEGTRNALIVWSSRTEPTFQNL